MKKQFKIKNRQTKEQINNIRKVSQNNNKLKELSIQLKNKQEQAMLEFKIKGNNC